MDYGLLRNEDFWYEVNLRAKNNYGDVRAVEEADAAVTNAIADTMKDLTEYLQESQKKKEVYAGVALDFGIDLGI